MNFIAPSTTIRVVLLAALLALLLRLLRVEEPIVDPSSLPSASSSSGEESLILSDPTYRYDKIDAPVATGTKLRFMSWLLTKTTVGPILRRHLLLKNDLTALRTLAAQVPDEIAPLHHPLHRLSRSERDRHDARGGADDVDPLERMLKTGIGAESARTLDYHRAYSDGTTTPDAVIEVTVDAINELQPRYRPFAAWPPPPAAMEEIKGAAARSTERYRKDAPLSVWDGVPVAFKDCVKVAGFVYSNGSQYHHRLGVPVAAADEDIMVKRFRELGAIILPPTSMVEGGVSPVGYNVYFGGPFNPHDRNHYSGGSSGGSAVAVSLGIVPMAIGLDGGGSIRTPASFSGVVGLALGFGRAPHGNGFAGRTMTKTGPLAATVDDAALAYAVVARGDGRATHFDRLYDGGVMGLPRAHLGAYLEHRGGSKEREQERDLTGVTLGIFRPWFDDADPGLVLSCRRAVDSLVRRGATIKDVAIPHLGTLRLAHAIKITNEFALEFDAAYHDLAAGDNDLLEPTTRIVVGLGASTTGLDVLAAEKLRGWAFDYVLRNVFDGDASVDAIVTPTNVVSAPRIDPRALEVGESNTPMQVELLKYVFLANLLGLPSVSVPLLPVVDDNEKDVDDRNKASGEGGDGMPVGLMFTGPQWSEDVLLKLASCFDPISPPKDYIDVVQRAKEKKDKRSAT